MILLLLFTKLPKFSVQTFATIMSYRGRGGGPDRRFEVKQRLRDKLLQSQRSDDPSGSIYGEQSNQNSERHPPELRGRDIGLWYARRNKEKRDRGEGPSEKRKAS